MTPRRRGRRPPRPGARRGSADAGPARPPAPEHAAHARANHTAEAADAPAPEHAAPPARRPRMVWWLRWLFALLAGAEAPEAEALGLPPDRVVVVDERLEL